MAIIYETGTAASPNDLLDKIATFLSSNGWAIDRQVVAGSGKELCVHKGTMYFCFRSATNETIRINGTNVTNSYGIAVTGADSYSAGQAWDLQPGYPVNYQNAAYGCHGVIADGFTGAITSYHFFSDTDYAHFEIEVSPGIWHRGGIGKLTNFNAAEGRYFYGAFSTFKPTPSTIATGIDAGYAHLPFYAARATSGSRQRSSSFLRLAYSAFNGWAGDGRLTSEINTTSYPSIGLSSCLGLPVWALGVNPLNGVAITHMPLVGFSPQAGQVKAIGYMPSVRLLDMGSLNPTDTIAIGAGQYRVFPAYQKGGISGARAICHRIV